MYDCREAQADDVQTVERKFYRVTGFAEPIRSTIFVRQLWAIGAVAASYHSAVVERWFTSRFHLEKGLPRKR